MYHVLKFQKGIRVMTLKSSKNICMENVANYERVFSKSFNDCDDQESSVIEAIHLRYKHTNL
jgi:hypothetical protein